MKRFILTIAVLVAVALVPSVSASVVYPQPLGVVNDYANLLSYQDRSSLEALIKNFEQETTNEIIVAVVPSFQGLDPFDYSQGLFNTWKIGKAGKNNGVLVVIGPKEGYPFPERGEIFINVGSGLEGPLPDSLAGFIRDQEFVPQFQAGQYAAGIYQGVSAIMKAVRNEYVMGTTTPATSSGSNNLFTILIVLGVFVIVAFVISKFSKKGGKGGSPRSSGGAFSGGGSKSIFGGGSSRGGGAGGSW